MSLLAGLILSTGIGLSLGLIGGGGSIITVPVLVYVIGVEVREAVGMSLAVVGATSVVGAALHHRRGAVRWRTGAIFGASGIAGAFVGSPLTYLVAPGVLLLAFAGLMLVTSVLMLTGGREHAGRTEHGGSAPKAVLAGFVVGVLTGFLGVGGGFLIVPALVLFGGLAMKDAVGTSLFVIALNSAAGVAGHIRYGGFDPGLTLLVAALAVAGVLIGSALSRRTPEQVLRRGFAVFVLLVAVFLVAENYTALLVT